MLFRAYDIRGIVGKELTAKFAHELGKAFATYLRRNYEIDEPRVLVGRDNRIHGRELMKHFVRGLVEHGCQVRTVDEGSTSPMISLWTTVGKYDAGVNVTASHNPPEYNGFKLVGREARSIAGDELKKIEKIIEIRDLSTPPHKAAGSVEMTDSARDDRIKRHLISGRSEPIHIAGGTIDQIASRVTLKRPLSIVIDAGNGISGKYYPELFERLGCQVHRLFCEQDGTFPNHEPDPSREENLTELKKMVQEKKADLGLAFDGDGDRVAVVDDKGKYHDANETFVLLIQDVLSRNSKNTPASSSNLNGPHEHNELKEHSSVIYTVSCSMIIPNAIKKLGGKGIMTPVGHSFVEQAMRKYKAILGGEQSGHFFIAENYYPFDDALYASAKLLELFARHPETVSALYNTVPRVASKPEFRPACADDKKFEIIEKLTKELAKKYPVKTLDGVRADIDKRGWLGIRASNTSPCLSVCMEGKTAADVEEIYQLAKRMLGKYMITI